MKNKRILLLASIGLVAVPLMSGCAAKALEKELNVVFMNEGSIVDTGTVTQFKNILTPSISSAYIPTDYKFLGWTAYAESELDLSDATHFKSQYIGSGRMVHYMDVKDYAQGETVVLNALMMHKDDIPKEYHYSVVAWYDKYATSGLNQDKMDGIEPKLKAWLIDQGVEQSDIDTIVFRAYAGNVGPTTGQILYDDDVDIMFGWGSLENISTTGSIPTEMVKESDPYVINYDGTPKNRYLHRLSDSEGAIKVTEYFLSEECTAYFAA